METIKGHAKLAMNREEKNKRAIIDMFKEIRKDVDQKEKQLLNEAYICSKDLKRQQEELEQLCCQMKEYISCNQDCVKSGGVKNILATRDKILNRNSELIRKANNTVLKPTICNCMN